MEFTESEAMLASDEPSKTQLGASVAFITMGCAKNEADSQRMKRLLQESGYAITDDVALADAIVVNTCSFIQSATEESLDAIFEAADLPSVKERNVPIVVSGCMPSRYGAELEDTLEEAAAFLPCKEEDSIAEVISKALDARNAALPCCSALQIDGSADSMEFEPDPQDDGRLYAYVKISDGCDRWCSYCTIPVIRGRYRSFSFDDIYDEVSRCVAAGKKEIVLIAQDTGRWGDDLAEKPTLAWLLDSLCSAFPDVWFRIMYIQPEGVTQPLLDTIAAHGNACRYLDVPIQHISQRILKDMNRSGSSEEFEALLERIRTTLPDAAVRTTLIAGFPGETEEEFEALHDFISEGHFDYVGVFPYSREEGTRAYLMDGQIDEDEKLYRAQQLRNAADAASAARIASRIGTRTRVLVEGCQDDGQLFGRSQLQAPEVDGVTFVDRGSVGCVMDCTVSDTLLYDMEADV